MSGVDGQSSHSSAAFYNAGTEKITNGAVRRAATAAASDVLKLRNNIPSCAKKEIIANGSATSQGGNLAPHDAMIFEDVDASLPAEVQLSMLRSQLRMAKEVSINGNDIDC